MSEDSLFRALTDIITSLEASLVDYSCAESHVVESVKGTNRGNVSPYNPRALNLIMLTT